MLTSTFPANNDIREKWVKFIGNKDDKNISKAATVCSKHFENSCYMKTNLPKPILRWDAVPN